MPRSRDTVGLTLSRCQELGQLIEVRCNYCRSGPRLYHPADLRVLVGNVEVDALRGRMKCEGCERRDWTEVKAVWLEAVQKKDALVRRLVRVQILRRPEWREEKL